VPDLDVEPARGQILMTSEIPNLNWKGTFHYDEGFYYFRNLGNRVLLGGARNQAFGEERTYDLNTSENIQTALEHFLHEKILPVTPFTIEYRWSGIMGVSNEKMPVVKQLSEQIFCAVRMGGMGVALAPIIGEKISHLMGAT
jgi:gamma-glutamylputrescine oxidase